MEIHSLEPLLAAHPFFAELDPEHRALCAGCAKNQRFEAGTMIFHEGDTANDFYLLRHGRVALELPDPQHEALVIQTVGEGDVFGFSALVAPYQRQFDARATELVRVLAFDGTCLRRKCETDPRLGYALLQRFSSVVLERLQATRLQLADLYGLRQSDG